MKRFRKRHKDDRTGEPNAAEELESYTQLHRKCAGQDYVPARAKQWWIP